MSEPLKAAYWENVDHLVDATEEIQKIRGERLTVVTAILFLLFGPAVLCGMVYYSNHGRISVWEVIGLTLFYYVLIWLFKYCRSFRRWQWKKFYARQFRGQPLAVEWIFSEADVIQRGGAESSTRFAWEHFKRVIRRSEGFLLETNHKMFHWIPRSSLPSEASFELLAGLLKQKVKAYEESRK